MEPAFIEWLVGQTGLTAVAILSLWLLNQAWRFNADLRKEHRERLVQLLADYQRINQDLKVVIKENTAVLATNLELLRDVQDRERG